MQDYVDWYRASVYPGNEGSSLLQNTGAYRPIYSALYTRSLEFLFSLTQNNSSVICPMKYAHFILNILCYKKQWRDKIAKLKSLPQ
jgi:hypothetical protein